jgi:predicted nucleic acid-binding Zn ribbon protein
MAANPRRPNPSADPTSIGRLVSRLLARTGYDREQSSSALASAWREAAPATLAAASRPGSVRRGVLEVSVSHSAHVQEFGFHKAAILERLRELVPDAGIRDIRCRVVADAGPIV